MASGQQPMLLSSEILPPQFFSRSPIPPEHGSNPFSRANVFGLFLTIAFSLLIQPYGSLLYMKPSSVLGRMLFFFWRLNPLACIMEVILLTIAFIDVIWLSLRQSLPASPHPVSFWTQLRTNITAIQLLRTHGKIPDHWRAFIDSWRHSSAAYDSTTNDASSPLPVGYSYNSSQPNPSASLGYQMSTTIDGVRSNSPESANSAGSYLDEPSSASSLDLTERRSSGTNSGPSSPQNYSDAESGGLRSTQSGIITSIGSSRLTGNDIGWVVLGRAEFVLNLVGSSSVAIAILRLASITIPIYIRLPAAFMVTSWAFVQVLHLTSSQRHADLVDTEYLIRRALRLERKLNHVAIWVIFSLLLLPLFGYFAFIFLFKTKPPLKLRMAFASIFFWHWILINPLVFQKLPQILSLRGMIRCSSRILPFGVCPSKICPKPTLKLSACIVFVISCWGCCACFGWLIGYSTTVCIFEDDPPVLYCIIAFSVVVCFLWAWFFLPGVPFMKKRDRDFEWIRGVALLYNLFMTGLFFTGAMMTYDVNDTYKPNWLDWLGKLHRL